MESLRERFLMLNEAINTYNNQNIPNSDYLKAHQAWYFAKSIEDTKAELTTYCEGLEKGELEEMFSLDFWRNMKSSKWLKGKKLETELRSLGQTALVCFGIAEETDGHITKTGEDLLLWIENAIKELRALLKKIKNLTVNLPAESFAKLYEKQSAKIDYEPVKELFLDWKLCIGKPDFKKLKAFHTKTVADFINSGLLRFAIAPTQRELDEVNMELVKRDLPPGYHFADFFKEHAAIFRRFIKWNGHILIIDKENYGKYVGICASKLSADELMILFQFERMLSLIHEEMMNLPPEERKFVLGDCQDTTDENQNPVDACVKSVLSQMKAEGMIENLYDYTWVMGVMNDTEGLPHFDSPSSFIKYLTGLGIENLPSESTIKKEYGKMLGKFPEWTFIGKDKTESDRRINVAKRFLNLYRNGVK